MTGYYIAKMVHIALSKFTSGLIVMIYVIWLV